MINPVNIGSNTAEWCSHVVKAFEALAFSVPVEFWMLDWKNEIRVQTEDWDTFKTELAHQLLELQLTDNAIGFQIGHPYARQKHPLAGWGVVR